MKNICKVFSDGTCIYIDLYVKSAWIGRFFLFAFNLFIFSGLLFLLVKVEDVYIGQVLVASAVFLTFYGFTVVRYTLWNFFGHESIIINTKTLTTQSDYGFFLSKPKTIELNGWALEYAQKQETKAGVQHTIQIFTYDEHDRPVFVYETGVTILQEDCEMITKVLTDYINNLAIRI
ncbi:MAG: hypothetical protein LPK19_01780, partial [Hymenobacteraceae bacterium]|nr:hypothetical protein [Hymenobacteraceae bacterium]MDX5394905.1 hypothetical protein [Hymenobacteraceae bacterium]MDX5510940.1 hypothetical protein [Hymenobacteraceae bacterium]